MTRRVSPASAAACLALVVALGGATTAGYAAGRVSGDKTIKKHSLSANRLKPDTVSGSQVKEASLAQVPSAGSADVAGTAGHAATADHAGTADHASTSDHATLADALPDAALHPLVPSVGWTGSHAPQRVLGWRLDGSGFVHLQGEVAWTNDPDDSFLVLPPAGRPDDSICMPVSTLSGMGTVCIAADGTASLVSGQHFFVYLDGISFHAGG